MARGKEATKPPAQRGKAAAAGDKPEADDNIDGPPIDIERFAKQCGFNPEGLIGDVADFLLQDLRTSRELKPWQKMREHEQELLISRAEKQAGDIVRRVIESVAHRGLIHMEATIEDKGGWGDGCFNMKISVPMTPENAAILTTQQRGMVQIVFANAKRFEGAMQTQAEPDQQNLIDEQNQTEAGEDAGVDEDGVIQDPPRTDRSEAPAPAM